MRNLKKLKNIVILLTRWHKIITHSMISIKFLMKWNEEKKIWRLHKYQIPKQNQQYPSTKTLITVIMYGCMMLIILFINIYICVYFPMSRTSQPKSKFTVSDNSDSDEPNLGTCLANKYKISPLLATTPIHNPLHMIPPQIPHISPTSIITQPPDPDSSASEPTIKQYLCFKRSSITAIIENMNAAIITRKWKKSWCLRKLINVLCTIVYDTCMCTCTETMYMKRPNIGTFAQYLF